MKKFLLAIILSVFSISLFSQIIINENDLPKPGRTNIVAFDTVPQVNLGAPSSSYQTWDLANLALHYNKYATYSSTSPYQQNASSFSSSNMYTYGPAFLFTGFYGAAPVDQSDWGYLFWSSDNTGLKIAGFRGDYGLGDKNVQENPQELLMGVPATIGSSFNNNAQWEIILNANTSDYDTNYVSKVNKSLVTDAFGQITTPLGTFNVIRVHEHAVRIDSSYASLNGFPLPYPGIILKKDTVNNYYFWAQNIGYPVAIAYCDANNQIKEIEYLTDTLPNYLITGRILQNDGTTPVTSGKVKLIAKSAWDALFGIAEEVNIMPDGHFQFSSVLGGNWLVQAIPDTGSFHEYMPTYYASAEYWQDADAVNISHDTSINIICNYYPQNINLANTGDMSGIVFQNTLSGAKSVVTPAEDISVILIDAQDSSIQRFGKTNHLGQYHFKNVQNRNYRIRVDIAGDVQNSTYDVIVNNSQHNNLDFVYDTTQINTYSASSIKEFVRSNNDNLFIYPNPALDNFNLILIDKTESKSYRINVTNIIGKVEFTVFQNSMDGVVSVNCKKLSSGIYFVNLFQNNTFVGTQKLVIK